MLIIAGNALFSNRAKAFCLAVYSHMEKIHFYIFPMQKLS